MQIYAIIPARGGSKRIPRKNIKNFLGKPIIQYSIEVALKSGLFDEVMVSTEDKKIAELAQLYGAKVPFMRSKKNASDYAIIQDVLLEVVSEYNKRGTSFDAICCIYPTAVFLTKKRIRQAISLLKVHSTDCVQPIIRSRNPIQRALRIRNGKIKMFWPNNYIKRSQDFEPTYYDCGQFFCIKVSSLLKGKINYTGNTVLMILKENRYQDIDDINDWQRDEYIYQKYYGRRKIK